MTASEKPLYYGWQRGILLFGSEFAALRSHPAFQDGSTSRTATLLRFGYVTAPGSITRVSSTPAGDVPRGGRPPDLAEGPRRRSATGYWSLVKAARQRRGRPFDGSLDDAANGLGVLLQDGGSGQMVADVPLGAFLSGGVDSSTVVALMQNTNRRPVQTFSSGFTRRPTTNGPSRAGVESTWEPNTPGCWLPPRHALDGAAAAYQLRNLSLIPRRFPLFWFKLARRHVTVSLSGDAGDELFCGYNRYFTEQAIAATVRPGAAGPWPPLDPSIVACPPPGPPVWAGDGLLPWLFRRRLLGETCTREPPFPGGGIAAGPGPAPCFPPCAGAAPVVLREPIPRPSPTRPPASPRTSCAGHGARLDQYLPDDILVKVDRAAMGVSLETRCHCSTTGSWSSRRLPRFAEDTGRPVKLPMRQVLARYVPGH